MSDKRDATTQIKESISNVDSKVHKENDMADNLQIDGLFDVSKNQLK